MASVEQALENRTLGTSGLEVSALGLGCMGLSYHRSATVTRDEAIALIRDAVDLGVTFFDTAQVYGPFTNEQLVGTRSPPSAIRSSWPRSSGKSTPAAGRRFRAGPSSSGRPPTPRWRASESTTIDLLYQHRVDPEHADRGGRRDGRGADRGRARSGTSACPKPGRRRSAARTPSRPLPRSRASTRCGGDSRRTRCSRSARSWASGSCPTARSGAASSPGPSTSTPPSTAGTTATSCRASRSRPGGRTRRWSTGCGRSASARAQPRPSSRWPGCWPRHRGSCRSREPRSWRRLQENLGAAAVELTSGDLAEIDSVASEVSIVGDRYPAELEQKTNR